MIVILVYKDDPGCRMQHPAALLELGAILPANLFAMFSVAGARGAHMNRINVPTTVRPTSPHAALGTRAGRSRILVHRLPPRPWSPVSTRLRRTAQSEPQPRTTRLHKYFIAGSILKTVWLFNPNSLICPHPWPPPGTSRHAWPYRSPADCSGHQHHRGYRTAAATLPC